MGTEAKQVRSERARRRWPEEHDLGIDSLQRSWPAVKKARMVLGLAATPALSGLIIWLGAGALLDNVPLGALLFFGSISIAVGAAWFIGLGSLFLVWLGRRWGVIERFNCLALCATLNFALPVMSALILVLLPNHDGDLRAATMVILAGGAVGLLFAPVGVFGGWVLWRIAVRPAEVPLKEIAEAF